MGLIGSLIFGLLLGVLAYRWLSEPKPSRIVVILWSIIGANIPVFILLMIGVIREGTVGYYACVLIGDICGMGYIAIQRILIKPVNESAEMK